MENEIYSYLHAHGVEFKKYNHKFLANYGGNEVHIYMSKPKLNYRIFATSGFKSYIESKYNTPGFEVVIKASSVTNLDSHLIQDVMKQILANIDSKFTNDAFDITKTNIDVEGCNYHDLLLIKDGPVVFVLPEINHGDIADIFTTDLFIINR